MSINWHEINESRAEIRMRARQMLAGELSYIEGSQEMSRLFNEARMEILSTPYVTFVGIDSETDRFPVGVRRNGWNRAALQRLDEERLEAEVWAKALAEPLCLQILTDPNFDPMDFP